MRSALFVFAVVLLSASAFAQQGGTKGRARGGSSGSRSTTAPRASADEPVATFEGTVTGVQHKKILVDDAEGNTMDFYTTKKTRIFDGEKEIKSAQLKTGDHVRVEAQRHMDGTVDAVNVRLVKGAAEKP